MLKDALLYDARGNPIQHRHKAFSKDWDEIRDWPSQVYMPYRVSPTGLVMRPTSTMHSARVGRITVTRFAYGIPVNIRDWSPEAGNAVVLTTIQGHARHFVDARNAVETGIGGTFVVDCSRTGYLVDLGSGLDQHQKAMTAARATAEA